MLKKPKTRVTCAHAALFTWCLHITSDVTCSPAAWVEKSVPGETCWASTGFYTRPSRSSDWQPGRLIHKGCLRGWNLLRWHQFFCSTLPFWHFKDDSLFKMTATARGKTQRWRTATQILAPLVDIFIPVMTLEQWLQQWLLLYWWDLHLNAAALLILPVH